MVAATPIGKRIHAKLSGKPFGFAVEIIGVLLGLILCTAALVSQSYNPFLYYQF